VDSSTVHSYDPRTQTYLQPAFAFQTLQRFITVNSTAISSLTTQNEFKTSNGTTIPSGAPLKDLIDLGLKEQALSPIVLSAVLEEIGQQTQ
jgi:small subunit ribosomal protein S29